MDFFYYVTLEQCAKCGAFVCPVNIMLIMTMRLTIITDEILNIIVMKCYVFFKTPSCPTSQHLCQPVEGGGGGVLRKI